ncbi:MAG: hypothetical protein C4308_14955 [Chitinophagaceae bacterium]
MTTVRADQRPELAVVVRHALAKQVDIGACNANSIQTFGNNASRAALRAGGGGRTDDCLIVGHWVTPFNGWRFSAETESARQQSITPFRG